MPSHRVQASAGQMSLAEGCRLNAWLGHKLAEAAIAVMKAASIPPADVSAIASHGHTVSHFPCEEDFPCTLQLGEAAIIAAETKCLVVSDFRQADMAQGV